MNGGEKTKPLRPKGCFIAPGNIDNTCLGFTGHCLVKELFWLIFRTQSVNADTALATATSQTED